MDKKFKFIDNKSEHLLNLLKGDNHSGKSTSTLIFLVVICSIVFVTHYIKYGFTPMLGISLLLMTILLIIYRVSMQSAFKENAANANYLSFQEVDPVTYIRTKLQYLYSGIMIKFTRTKSIRFLYSAMFPFILFLSKEIFLGRIEGFIGNLIFAVLLGAGFWWMYFRNEVEDLGISRDDIKGYLESL